MATIVGFLTVGSTLSGTEGGDLIYGNARGTVNVATGSDRIFGRGGDDRIVGDAGEFDDGNGDTIAGDIGPAGRGGNDVIQGGDGDDLLFGDTDSTLFGIGGNDTLYQNAGEGGLFGDAAFLSAGARCGNDRLFGDILLVGDAFQGGLAAVYGDDLLVASGAIPGERPFLYGDVASGALGGNARGGNDIMRGSSTNDQMVGDAEELADNAAGGNDRLEGNGGVDILFGDVEFGMSQTSRGGNDVLRGGAGDAFLLGEGRGALIGFVTCGNDRLEGGTGDDNLWGDAFRVGEDVTGGKDRFIFAGSFGDDRVNDFRQDDGDLLLLKGLTQLDVQISIVTVNDPNDSTLITTLGGDSITLVGFTGTLAVGTDIVFA